MSQKKFDPGDTLTAFSSPVRAAGRFGLGSSEGFVKNVLKRSIVTVASMTLEIVRGNMNRGNCNRLIKDKAVKALVAVRSSSPNNANAANVKLETSTGADDQDSAPNSVMNV